MRGLALLSAAFLLSAGCIGGSTGESLRDESEAQLLLFRLEGSLEAAAIRGEGRPPGFAAYCLATVFEFDNGTIVNYEYDAERDGPSTSGALLFGEISTNTPLWSGCGDNEFRYLPEGQSHVVSVSDTFSGRSVQLTRGSGTDAASVSLGQESVPPGGYAHLETDWTWEYEHKGESWTLMYWLNLTLRNEGPIPASRVWHALLSEL